MKKVINFILALCIVGLIYIVYGSIMGPIKFANAKSERDKAVITRLTQIKDAQTEYNHQRTGYCNNFDSLAAFIKTAKLPITKKVGELTDDQLDANWTESKVLALYQKARNAEEEAKKLTGRRAANKKYEADTLWQRAAKEGFIEILEDGTKNFLFSRETDYVSLYDSLYHGLLDPDSIGFIPFGNGALFELETDSEETKSGLVQYSFIAKAPYKVYLDGLDKQEIINLLEECDDRGRYRGLTVDNNSGNWE